MKVQVLSLGMSIRENDIDTFFKLLAVAIGCFELCGNTNYKRTCTLFLLQWTDWISRNHPILPTLRAHFLACSEEYGETAIHLLMTHIREWDYAGDNLTKRWHESSAASWCFEFHGIARSHKTSSTKRYYEASPSKKIVLLASAFDELCTFATQGVLSALKPSPGFSDRSQIEDDLSIWHELPEQYNLCFYIVADRISNLKTTLERPYDLTNIPDHDIFFSETRNLFLIIENSFRDSSQGSYTHRIESILAFVGWTR